MITSSNSGMVHTMAYMRARSCRMRYAGSGATTIRTEVKKLLLLLWSFLLCFQTWGAEDYKLGADSQTQDGVPRGEITKHRFAESKIFPETTRDYWIYTPKQYDASKPACLMVFQDGSTYVSSNGQFRVPVVFDNLIHKKEMPVTVAVFINPGEV